MAEQTEEEKRESVLFHARFEYSQQLFHVDGTSELYQGDPFTLPPHVSPLLPQRRRWEYWREVLPRHWTDVQIDAYQYKHWCGAFSLFCLHKAGLGLEIFWRDGLGYVEPNHFPHVRIPKPGDVAYFAHNSHYALVERVRGNLFDTIDGNQGLTLQAPSIKCHAGRDLTSAAAFYSISPLLVTPPAPEPAP